MENQAKTNTEQKEQQLKKLSKMSLIRSLLPVVGLVVIFLLFNVLTNFRMVGNLSLVLSQVYVTMIAATGVFFVTICTMFLFRGFIKYLTTNAPVAGSAKLINYDSTALKMTLTIIVVVIGFIAFRFTKFGTYLKAIGAGEKAAMFSGIRTDRMKFLIYVLAGAITGFAAFINVIKVGSVTSSGGNQLETQILIALVLGGMPISGGAKVRFENIIVGSLLYIVLSSGLTMMGFTTQMMQLIQGVVFLIFVAVFADRQSLQVIK